MKIVINETQYDRLFNKPKTKLVLTESQFNRLITEDQNNSFHRINNYDKILITKSNGDELHFKVLSINGTELMMVNLDNGVYKDYKFYIREVDLQNHNLKYKSTKDIKTPLTKKDEWKNETFKNIKRFSVFYPNDKPKYDIDAERGKPKEVKPPEEFGGDELTKDIEIFLNKMGDMREDDINIFYLKDGNELRFEIKFNNGNRTTMELIDGDKSFSTSEGSSFEFINSPKNVRFKDKNDIDIKLKKYFNKEEEEGDETKLKFVDIIINGINKIESVQGRSEREEKEAEEDAAMFDWDTLEDMARNSQDLKDIIQTRPSAVLDLMRLSSKKGIIPGEDILRKWSISIKNGEVDYPGNKFIADKKLHIEFLGEGKIIDAKYNYMLDKFEELLKNHNGKVGVKVDKMKKGATKLILSGYIDNQPYKLEFVKELEAEDTYEFNLKLEEKKKSGKQIKLALFKIKVNDYDA